MTTVVSEQNTAVRELLLAPCGNGGVFLRKTVPTQLEFHQCPGQVAEFERDAPNELVLAAQEFCEPGQRAEGRWKPPAQPVLAQAQGPQTSALRRKLVWDGPRQTIEVQPNLDK